MLLNGETRMEKVEFLIVDGFGQEPYSPVTWEVAYALRLVFPDADVREPIATATVISPIATLQLPFGQQAKVIRNALLASQGTTHVYAYSQGCIATVQVLASQHWPQVASVTLVGCPLDIAAECSRVERLNVAEMGHVYEYVQTWMPPRVGLAGVVRYERGHDDLRYVAIPDSYAQSWPTGGEHYADMLSTIRGYRTTFVVLGGERVTDCTPEQFRGWLNVEPPNDCTPDRAAKIAGHIGMSMVEGVQNINPNVQSQGVVIPDACHRLGSAHRRHTIPELYKRLLAVDPEPVRPGRHHLRDGEREATRT